MIKINDFTIKSEDIISTNNLIKMCDIVYAAFLPDEDFNNLDKDIFKKVTGGNGLTIFKTIKFSIKENDVIFCHTMFIEPLFIHLNKINEFSNIKLVTSQTDLPITKKLFLKKPKCVSQWFSINVDYEHSNLIPIPLGIVGGDNAKNLTEENFKTYNDKSFKRLPKIYSNFNLNTNYFHRYKIFKLFSNKHLLDTDRATMQLNQYSQKLKEYKFSLAPWGNGYDTHRLWESLYSGCIPITKYHKTFHNLDGLPILFFNKPNEINQKILKEYSIVDANYEKLKLSWWMDLINFRKEKSKNIKIDFYEDDLDHHNSIVLFYKIYHKLDKNKKYKTLIRKIHARSLGRKINDKVGL